MDKIIYVVKWVSLFQAALIFFFIILLYLTRIFFVYVHKWKQTQTSQVEQQLHSNLEHTPSSIPNSKQNKWFQKHIENVLYFLSEAEKQPNKPPRLSQFKQELSEQVLKPAARKLAHSRRWTNRYMATLCFSYGFDEQDQTSLQRLITDEFVLVSVNAAQIAIKQCNALLINTMISFYSQGRRLQQSAFANLLAKDHAELYTIIEQRLQTEIDIYTRIYCYHLLENMPVQKPILAQAKTDLLSHSIDLKIAALHYVAGTEDLTKNELIYSYAQDTAWEVRAVVAKLLGNIHTEQSLQLKATMLRDSQWWVRINAAQALGKSGEQGLQILQSQSAEQDQFAFEAAEQALIQLQMNRKS